ncbi:MAG: cysteine--tRNA ligase [Chloroflexi bacterium]|nr:cysteine--tRNA ligase [Chloroflexota bacterium]
MTDQLRLYDTLSGGRRDFEPSGPEVKIYVCGVTPYDTTHLGHAFTYVSFDVLIRYLRYLGHRVRYVQNVTDVDDPLFAKARQLGISHWDLAAEQTERYLADMRALNVLPAEVYPRASGEIAEMIEVVASLISMGHAYAIDGYVYFSIATDPGYGRLSKYDRSQMIEIARERGGDPDDPRRRDPLDFLLWRPAKDDEPRWPSPWGDGLPGWHLECSAMALKYLGAPLDIHGGGGDLVFPHHESEIAQTEGATGRRPFSRYWMHSAMVCLGGQKMSKSLGNMVFARDLITAHGANALRLYISSCHYRTELHYDGAELDRAADLARNLATAATLPTDSNVLGTDVRGFRERFVARMNDDLDTPGAIGVIHGLADVIRADRADGRNVEAAQALLAEIGGVIGLRLRPDAS